MSNRRKLRPSAAGVLDYRAKLKLLRRIQEAEIQKRKKREREAADTPTDDPGTSSADPAR